MSKIKVLELKPNSSHLQELSNIETASVIGGYDSEAESSRDIIQKAMQEAVIRSDISSNRNSIANS